MPHIVCVLSSGQLLFLLWRGCGPPSRSHYFVFSFSLSFYLTLSLVFSRSFVRSLFRCDRLFRSLHSTSLWLIPAMFACRFRYAVRCVSHKFAYVSRFPDPPHMLETSDVSGSLCVLNHTLLQVAFISAGHSATSHRKVHSTRDTSALAIRFGCDATTSSWS